MNTFFTHCSTRLFAGFQKQATTTTSFTKQLLLQLAVILFTVSSYAQITNMRFTNEAATYVPITGGTSLVGPGSGAGTPSGVVNIGFTFKFQGVDYTQFSANAAGLLKLGSVVVTNEGGATDNSAITTFNTPKIYALWDKFYTGTPATGGGITYLLTGTAPNRALTVQWKVAYAQNGATSTNFQVKLYETSNKIEFYYGAAPALSGGASVGIGGLDAVNDYLSVFTQNSAISNAVNFNSNTVIPGAGAGMKYTFTPTADLTSSPACLTDQPNFWVKADAGVNSQTRTLLNVPAANRSSPSVYTQTPAYNPANTVLTGSPGWMPSMAEGANSTPTGSNVIGAITLDLGSVQSIDGVATLGSGTAAYYTTDYTVKVSNDNVTWTNLGMFKGNDVATELHYADFDAPVTCRYVRVIPGGFKTYRAIRLDVYTKSAAAATTNNTKVTVWDDLSGNKWDAQQPTTVANQPTYLTNQFNFNPAVNFPAATNKLDVPDFTWKGRFLVSATALNTPPTLSYLGTGGTVVGPTGILELGEMLTYKNLPTASQQNVIESYLATKYGITKATDYVAADGTTKTFDLTANAGYTNNIFGIGRADCQDLHQRQSKSSNLDGLISIGNNNTIDFTNGNTSTSGNNIATDNSYLILGDNGGALDLNTAAVIAGKYYINRTWKLQETGTIGSVKISVPGFGNTAATRTLPDLLGNMLFQNATVYVAADDDGNFANGGTTFYPMTAVGSGATLTYEVNVDLANNLPYLRIGVEKKTLDTDGDGVIDIEDLDADNDGILNVVESPSCFYTADYLYDFIAVSSELAQHSTNVITNSIDASATSISGFAPNVSWVGKELFKFTANGYVASPGIELSLVSYAISSAAGNTFKLQGSTDDVTWTDLSTARASTGTTGKYTVPNTLAPNSKFKYYRIIGVAGVTNYGHVQNAELLIPASFNRSAFPMQNCTTGSDADGKPNHLDLDSDGDGCFDAIEAGIVATSTDGMVGTTANVGLNGLADTYETAAESGINKSTYNYEYAINSAFSICKDTDNDGIYDVNDIDSDNDGILNAVESPTCFFTWEQMRRAESVSSEITQHSTFLISYSIDDNLTTKSQFINGLDWVGKEIFKFTLKGYTPVTGVTLTLKDYALSSAGSNTFRLQGSGDGVEWTNLSAIVSSTAATGTFYIGNTLATTSVFKYLRIVGVAGVSNYGGVTDVAINIPPATYNRHLNPMLTCVNGVDTDNVPNHLDLDSDGDGCFDALEAGVVTTSTDGIVGTASNVGANGLADTLETVDDNGIYNATYTYDYAITKGLVLCADLDTDGIKDINDLDDDNDGILDHIESPACFVTPAEMSIPVNVTTDLDAEWGIRFAFDQNSTTVSRFFTNQAWTNQVLYHIEAAAYTTVSGISLDLASWAISSAATNTFKLQGSQDNYHWSDLSAAVASTATTGTFTVNNTLLPNTKFKYLRVIGVAGLSYYGGVSEIRINIPAGVNSSAFPKDVCTTDTDTDGKLNHQDVDSDGDTCFDGVEAGVLPKSNTTGVYPGTAFGANGLADGLETATESGISKIAYYYDYAVNATIVNCTDTDNDGLSDLIDIDDDNDGFLDSDESPTCFMTFQEWNTANKTEFVKITSDLTTLAPNTNFAALTDNTTTAAVQFATATAQSQYNKEIFRATFSQPIQLDAFYIKKASATQIFNSGLMVQGTNDVNGTWTNLLTAAIASPADATNLTANGTVSLTNSNKFTIGVNAGKYKYYRIYGLTAVNINAGIATEFYFDVNRTTYAASSYPRAICTTDTDGDDVLNHLDLDSDNDGCADAVEGNANRAATSTSTHPTGTDANNNGLLDNYEGTPAGTVSYYPTYNEYAIVASINACLDTDGDTVPDSKDLDDDNDGILDADEQINCAYPQKDLSTLTFNGNANGVISGTTLTLAGPGSWSSKYSDQKLKLPIHLEFTVPTLSNGGMIGLLPVGAAKTPANYNDGAYKIYATGSSINGFIPASTGNKINRTYVANELMEMDINAAGVVTVRQNGWVIYSYKGLKRDYNLAFSALNAKVFENIKLTSYSPLDMVCEDIDSDGDGIVNRLDLDSDNDGCNDAVEAGATNTTGVVPFTGAVGTNGVVDSLEDGADSGDLMYVSTYSSYAKNPNFNACADTDGDGVGDLKDIDDDNDGVTDDIEEGCSSPLFVNKTSTSNLTSTGNLTGTILKETGNIDYELNMKGPALLYYPTYFEGGNGLHFQVSDYNRMNIDMDFKLTSTSFETSPVAGAPKIKWVDFGPNVPVNLVQNQPINEAQNITLTWPGAYGVVYDPFNQLSSHNTGDIIESGDLIEQNVAISAADITAKKTWKVRMFMHNTSDVYLINANIYGDAILGQQSYGFNVSACSIFDTDADGIPNTRDSDSDGDGTSDAFEGNATTNTTLMVVPGPYGDNGFADSLETSDEIDATVNYTTTYNQATASNSNKAADTDGDGVLNVIDIDDDNDGILDSEETTCGPAYFSTPNLVEGGTGQLQTVTGNFQSGGAYADYEINLVGVSNVFIAGSEPFNQAFDNSKGGLHYLILDNDNTYSQTFKLTPTYPTTLSKVKFGVNVPSNAVAPTRENNRQSILMTWTPDVPAVIYDPNDQIVEFATGAVVYSGTTITLRSNYTLANSTWRVDFGTEGSSEQFFLQTTHRTTNTADNVQYEGFGINADLCFVEDTDGDGIPDYLDNDSDGDGCSDAFEAGAISTPGGPTQKLTGAVGANGLVDSIENNDTEAALITYASTAYMAYSPVSSCADTDGDGVPDRDDMDDDNDGITDYIEYDCGIGTFVKSYIVTAGLGMSIGGTFNNGNYKGSGTFTFSNLSALNSVSDATNYANYKINDSNKEYGMKALLVPTNGILSSFEFGPNLSNTANASTVNGQQSITVSWNLPVGGIVYDPDDQLTSHADGVGINPGGTLVTKADYTVAESTWKIIVPLPYINTAINFTANVTGVANLGEESFGIGLYVCNKKPDLDGDGKVNAVDIDSDGDGCSDFVEAKSFKWASLNDQTIAGPFGVNGLSSLVESNDTQSASLNYTVSKNYVDKEHAGCIDDDGDGGASVDDIDDDNDGILDQTECPTEPAVSKFGFVRANPAGTQMYITNKVTGVNLGLITIKAIKTIVVDDLIGNENDNSVGGHWLDLSTNNATDRVMEIKFEPVAPYTVLDLKVLATEGGNGKWGFHPRSLRVDGGIAGNGIIRAIPQRYYLKERYSVGDTITPSMKMSTAFTGMLGGDANKVFIQVQYDAAATVAKPLVLTYTWNSLAGGVWNENFGFQLLEMVPMLKPLDCDYDGDGLNDDKDTDSDNDGCSDAEEARHGMPLTADRMHVAGPYGENGFTKYFETNDTPQATYTTTGWLPAPGGTITTQKDYVNENVKTRCLIPFIVPIDPIAFCAPGSTRLTINLNGGDTPTAYQWYKDGVIISGATANAYTATETGLYSCEFTFSDGTNTFKEVCNPQDVTANPAPTAPVVTASPGTTVCLGTPATLTSSYTTGNQWYYNTNSIVGATAVTYAASASGDYKVEYTDPETGCKNFSTTTVVVIAAVPAKPTVELTQPTCTTTTGTITVTPSGNAGDTYTVTGTSPVVAAATNGTGIFSGLASGTYTVVTTNANGCSSAAETVVINAALVVPATPAITAGSGLAICAGGATTLTSSASTGNQWYKDGSIIAGATSATFTAAFAGSYTVQATSTDGCSTTSPATVVTVSPSPTASLTQSTVLSSSNCGTASPILLTASTDATGATYAWYKDGVVIGGATASTYTAVQTGSYTVKITNGSGCPTISAPSSVTTGPSASAGSPASICIGQNFTFTATVTGFTSPTFAWEYSADGSTGWATPSTGITNTINYAATTAGFYRVVVSDNTPQSITSCPTELKVNPLPTVSIGASPAGALCAGQTTTLTATAAATSPATIASYQWLDGATNIAGAATATYTTGIASSYAVSVTDSNGCQATTAPATVAVNALPVATIATVTQPTCATATGTITVTAPVGSGYEYSINGGTYQSSPIFSGLAANTYIVKAKLNGCEGPSTSEVINTQPITLSITGTISGNATPLLGGSETYTITAVPGAISYIWTLPNGWSGTSTSNTIITTPAAMTGNTGTITVKAVSADGCESTPVSLTVAIKPAAPTVASAAYCQNATATALTATADAGGTLNWYTTLTGSTVPSSLTPTTTTAGTTSYFVSQTVNGVESDRAEIIVTINAIPAQPGAISGATSVLSGSVEDYSIAAVSGADSYVWTLPSGTTGTSTAAAIRTTFGSTAGSITVKAVSAAGCESPLKTMAVIIKPAAPIVTPEVYCQFTPSAPLTATPVSGATLNWYTVATGGTASSTAPTPSRSVVGTTSYFVSQTLGGIESDRSEITVTINSVPAQPGTITGTTAVVVGTTEVYTIAAVAGATSYTWTLPNGWTGTSTTETISATVGSLAGNIKVTANANGCSSPAAIFALQPPLDSDGDGVSDADEAIDGTDPYNPCDYDPAKQYIENTSTAWQSNDCDGDGLTNKEEKTGIDDPSTPANPNGKITDPLNVDTDGDGVTDAQEAIDGTDPTNPCSFKLASQTLEPSSTWKSADCDSDGLTNQEEKTGIDNPLTPANPNGKITDPLNVDTDGDGVTDAQEAIDGTDPTNPCSFKLASHTVATSTAWNNGDCDGDGLTNQEEKTGIDNPATPANPNGKITDPLNVDTDGDGVTDAQEAIDGTDPTNPCSFKLTSQTVATSTAWNNGDCDGDGLTNQEEKTGIDNPATPANPNGKITDPLNVDTDGDGVTDAKEAIDGTDPTNPCAFVLANQTVATSTAWNTADCDGDGESNSVEKTNGTDPLVTCSNSIPFPAPTITSSGSIVCSGTAITLTSSVASAYQWFKDGVAVNGATAQNFVVYDSGSYTVQVLNSLGCTSIFSNAEVTVVSTPPTADITEGAVLAMNSACNGTPINLTVSTNVTGATYQWTKDGVDILGATSATYNATDAGLYRVKVSKGGCTTESAATKILPAANASSSVNPTLCAGDSVQLSVNASAYSSAATYQWKKGGVVIASATAPTYDATQTGVYTVEVTDGATTVSCPITVTVNALPVITIAIAPAATICAGDTSTMTAAVTGSSPFTYKWRTNGIEINTATATSFGATTSGVYDVRVADANGCEAISAPSTIVVNALPTQVVATATSQPTCSIGTGTITVSSPAAIGGMTYSIDGTTYTNTSGIFVNIIPGTYTVTAKNANGCVGPSATVVINAQPITPAQPGVISGTLNVLPGATYVYTISPVTGATSYTWTLPNGWGGTSTTTSISAIVATTGGTITVVANAGACISPASSLVVSIDMTSDTDGDGVLDSKEILDGTDPNDPCEYSVSSITVPTGSGWNDADCDNDGLTNGEETTGIDNPSTPENPKGIITDPSNEDSDGDGVTDGQEAIDGTNPNDPCNFKLESQSVTPSDAWKAADCDADGLTNQEEKTGIDDPSTPANPNGKITDPLNKDTDGDGVTDGQEAIDGTNPNDVCSYKATSQTLTPSDAWKAADCDADGLTNQEEKTGIDDPSTPANPNGKITDPLNKDTDGDGVTDAQEAIDGTNPNDQCSFKLASQTLMPSNAWKAADCDADGLTNQEEKTGIDDPSTPANPNGKITDPLNVDTDGDGVTDGQEAIDGTNPNDVCSYKATSQTLTPSDAWKAADCDADGLTNQEEKTGIDDPSTPANPNGKITDPLNKDTDGDGVTDGQEAIDGTNPNDVCSYKATSQTLTPSDAWKAADCDADGLTNQEEKTGIDDPSTPANPNGKITDPLNKDTDGDGVTDGQEAIDGTNPNDVCSFKLASQTLTPSNAWKAADCDADGLTNQEEKTGIDDPSTPANPNGKITDPLNVDTDGDGVTDGQEAIDGTNPNDVCSYKATSQTLTPSDAWKAADCDADGLTNQEEKTGIDDPSTPANPNGKITDPLNKDTDGDGVTDAQEAIDGTNPNDACSLKLTSQTLPTGNAWNNADCDGDGVTNGQEKIDGTNPNNSCDSKPIHVTLPFSSSFLAGDCDGDGLSNGNELGKIATSPQDIDKNGVPDYLEVTKYTPGSEELEVYNSVSPNGDGDNDIFVIRNIENYPNNTVSIYNRWGVLVFEVDGYGQNDKVFRGISEGRVTVQKSEELPEGTYFYILRYANSEGAERQRSGYLYIKR